MSKEGTGEVALLDTSLIPKLVISLALGNLGEDLSLLWGDLLQRKAKSHTSID